MLERTRPKITIHESEHTQLLPKGEFHPPLTFNKLSCHLPDFDSQASLLHITDLHLGSFGWHSWATQRTQEQIIDSIVTTAQDCPGLTALLFTGDLGTRLKEFSWHNSASSTYFEEILSPLASIDTPKFATLGNHDTHSDVAQNVLNSLGFTTLSKNQSDPLLTNMSSGNISLWALPDFQTERERHDEICRNIKAFHHGISGDVLPVIMAHNPDSFDYLPKDLFFLGLSGHTHAGCYVNPVLRSFALWKLGLLNPSYVSGTIPTPAGGAIYTGSGAGRHTGTPFSDVPMGITLVEIC